MDTPRIVDGNGLFEVDGEDVGTVDFHLEPSTEPGWSAIGTLTALDFDFDDIEDGSTADLLPAGGNFKPVRILIRDAMGRTAHFAVTGPFPDV